MNVRFSLNEAAKHLAGEEFIFFALGGLVSVFLYYWIKAALTLRAERKLVESMQTAADVRSLTQMEEILRQKPSRLSAGFEALLTRIRESPQTAVKDGLVPSFGVMLRWPELPSTLAIGSDTIVRMALTLTFVGISAALIVTSSAIIDAAGQRNGNEVVGSVASLIQISSYKFIISATGLFLSILLGMFDRDFEEDRAIVVARGCAAIDSFFTRQMRVGGDDDILPYDSLDAQLARLNELLSNQALLIQDVIPQIFKESLKEISIKIDPKLLSHLQKMHDDLLAEFENRNTQYQGILAMEMSRLSRTIEANNATSKSMTETLNKLEGIFSSLRDRYTKS